VICLRKFSFRKEDPDHNPKKKGGRKEKIKAFESLQEGKEEGSVKVDREPRETLENKG